LLERAVLPAETQRVLLERAGGNPLYAEEFARLLADRGQLDEDQEVPQTVQALIAARLDTLMHEVKSLLQDAAVVGKIFWAGALAQMGGRDPREVELTLHELARKELVRSSRRSSMAGETEYAFWHGLVRDVCYGQMPRRARADRHRAAAAWLEATAGERAEDLADVLAHHYLQSLELARAAGDREALGELGATARRYLALAGERALALDVASAEQSLRRALALAPKGDPARGLLLERWAHAAQQQGRLEEANAALEEAVSLYRARDEPLALGRALTDLVAVLANLGDPRRVDVIVEAIALLEEEPPGPELVAAYAEQCAVQVVSAAYDDAIDSGDRAVDLARSLGLAEPVRGLIWGAVARAVTGDRRGLAQVRRGFEASLEQGRSFDAAIALSNLDLATWELDGPAVAAEQWGEAAAFCERRGITRPALYGKVLHLSCLAACGHTAEAVVAEADALVRRAEEIGYLPMLVMARSLQLRLLAHRGERATGAALARQLAQRARKTGVPWLMAFGLAAAAQILASEHRDEASRLLEELADGSARYKAVAANVTERVRCALGLSLPEVAARLAGAVEPRTTLDHHADVACRAQLAEHGGDVAGAATLYAEAIERWRAFGDVQELAYALLGYGRCLAALGNRQAEEPLREARDLFASMGYKPALGETDALLGPATAAAS
jgi:tetratricopeptide (TPR) repeat protein